jgi:16S rRNA A1518/A1519 N6-dimethyltransferase RsmA/KsgA/DIM1 with predicted DNA glycosylase/AP lyase activity
MKLNEDIIKLVNSYSSPTILEIGCRTGQNIDLFLEHCAYYYAYEADQDLFMEARRFAQGKANVFLTCGNALRVAPNKYDFVLINQKRPELVRQAIVALLKRNLTSNHFMVVVQNYVENSFFIDKFFKDIMVRIGSDLEAAAICITQEKKKELEERLSKEAI